MKSHISVAQCASVSDTTEPFSQGQDNHSLSLAKNVTDMLYFNCYRNSYSKYKIEMMTKTELSLMYLLVLFQSVFKKVPLNICSYFSSVV